MGEWKPPAWKRTGWVLMVIGSQWQRDGDGAAWRGRRQGVGGKKGDKDGPWGEQSREWGKGTQLLLQSLFLYFFIFRCVAGLEPGPHGR